MLKIIDDVDLKELEKFGFEYNNASWSQNYLCPGMVIRKRDKIIILTLLGMGNNNQPGANKLYDLIKAGLVEKVGDEQMTAKEMFEKLGYEYEESYDKKLIDYYKKYNNLNLEVLFDKEEKTFCFTYVTKVDIKLLQAINKQVEELGWNER